jgi:hypothetical protein
MFSDKLVIDFCKYLFMHVFNVDRIPEFSLNTGIIRIIAGDHEYSEASFDPEHILITEEEIVKLIQIQKEPDIFLNNYSADSSSMPFLKLSAYFITEQYFSSKRTDAHGRLSFGNVDEKIKPILSIPIVDVIAIWFTKKLALNRNEKKIILSCDYDILNLWANLSFFNSLRVLIHFLRQADYMGFAKESLRFLQNLFSKKSSNPYLNDSMFYYKESPWKIENVAFWLIHFSHPPYDIKNDFNDKKNLNFIESLKGKNVNFGLHPSYDSMDNPGLLLTQQEEYKSIFGHYAGIARFHYLRNQYPDCLQHLLKAGIGDDYSFYFYDTLSFRGGISSCFKYWDFSTNMPVDVEIHPLTLMDGTLNDYLKLSKGKATQCFRAKINLALKYGSEITLIWHNRSMYKHGFPNNYQPEIYKTVLQEVLEINLASNTE